MKYQVIRSYGNPDAANSNSHHRANLNKILAKYGEPELYDGELNLNDEIDTDTPLNDLQTDSSGDLFQLQIMPDQEEQSNV